MAPKYCPDYVGLACVDGTCPIANREEREERCMDTASECRGCWLYKGCEDCIHEADCERKTVNV